MILAAYHQAYKNRKATEAAIKSYREHNDGPYFLVSDGGDDFSDIAKKYDCYYYHSKWNLEPRDHTHPSGIYGMKKEEILEWLNRFYLACTVQECDHIILMEDDVLVRQKIDVDKDVEFCGVYNPGNKLQRELIDYLEEKYDAKFFNDYFSIPGGSIFNAKTFVENYDRVTKIFEDEVDYIKDNLCRNFGWSDVWMTVYYYLCRKPYTINPYHTEANKNPNWRDPNYGIIHHYKEHYENLGYNY